MLKIQREIKLTNNCNAIYDEDELINAMLWYSENPVISIKKVSMHGKYPAVSIGKEKIHIHRLLMMYRLKSKLPKEYYVHHEDNNRLNASKENLSLIYEAKHQSNHNKNKILSTQHKNKILEANKKRKGIRHQNTRKDVTPKMVYDLKQQGKTFNQISILFKLDWGGVKQRYFDFIHENSDLLKGGAVE